MCVNCEESVPVRSKMLVLGFKEAALSLTERHLNILWCFIRNSQISCDLEAKVGEMAVL